MIIFQNKINILDFFDLVEKCEYPRKAPDLMEITTNWDSTYYVFKEGISRTTSKNIKETLGNLEEVIKEKASNNPKIGKIEDLELYAAYLEKDSLCFGLENKKTKRACEISVKV